MYPGVCVAFAFDRPAVVPAGDSRHGRYRVWVADGILDRDGVAALTRLPSIMKLLPRHARRGGNNFMINGTWLGLAARR